MKREIICLSCPTGCHIAVQAGDGDELDITGNQCPRGLEYAREEYLAPKRIVTATCRSTSGRMRRVPVRTTRPLPVAHVDDLLKELYALDLSPPMAPGDMIIRDFRGTDVDVVLSSALA